MGEPRADDMVESTRRRLRRRVLWVSVGVAWLLILAVFGIDAWQCCADGTTLLGISADALAAVLLGAWASGTFLVATKRDTLGLGCYCLAAIGGFFLSAIFGAIVVVFVLFAASQLSLRRST